MRGMTRSRGAKKNDGNFNPHPPMRGMTIETLVGSEDSQHFNPHPPMRGMTFLRGILFDTAEFQSTSPYAGDDAQKSYVYC